MWNWDWQSLIDYGSRYDYGFYEISEKELLRFNAHNVYRPVKGWVGTMLKDCNWTLPSRTEIIDQGRWVYRANKLGGMGAGGKELKLTRGVQAACWAIGKMFKGDRLVLVGFDNTRAGKALSIEAGFPQAYVDHPGKFPFRDYVGGTRRYHSHDYGVEAPLLKLMTEEKIIQLVYAEDIW